MSIGGGGVFVLHSKREDPPDFAVVEVVREALAKVLGLVIGDAMGLETMGDVFGGETLTGLQEGEGSPLDKRPVDTDGVAGADPCLVVR